MREDAQLIFLDKTDSTNSYAEEHLDEFGHLGAVVAEYQSEGHGQYDHSWHSRAGENILMSIVLKPEMPVQASDASACLSPAVSLGVLDYLREKGVQGRIKWPNDIWVGDKKICGLLIKTFLQEGILRSAVIGVGFNLNEISFPDTLPNPVSLRQLTGVSFDLRTETICLYKKICHRSDFIATVDGRISLQEEFEKYMFRLP